MNKIAKALLETQSVHIVPEPENFYTWTSGKRSPIYCDNRQLISHPNFRRQIVEDFIDLIKVKYPTVELIAGTATAGIPWAAWIAEGLNLPMVYIRSRPKGHGLKSAIEGKISKGQKVLIIEDLISTGKSSIEAVNHAKADHLEVQAVLSIFTYGFKEANAQFDKIGLEKVSLCNLDQLLKYARDNELLTQENVETVSNWKNSF
jgi:orotate phosphoribosyltransferase